MVPKQFMLIAGEASGDLLAAELVRALNAECLRTPGSSSADAQPLHTELAPRCFGAGGPQMAAAGVELAFDMTQHSVIGLWEVIQHYPKFQRLFNQLLRLALQRQPDAIVCVDFSGFNRRFAHAIRASVRRQRGSFNNWNPKIIQFVSPQVWASREGRAFQMAEDFDLLLSIFPFEKPWYARRVPKLRVEFVGHPMLDRHASAERGMRNAEPTAPLVLLLPGSRPGELKRHWQVMIGSWRRIESAVPGARARIVLPDESLLHIARSFNPPANLTIQKGGLAESLIEATVAIASTGTVTLECACFGVPTVALYKTSWLTYEIGKRLVKVKYLAMPNLLAGETVFPEFIQHEATAENIARAALELLRDAPRRAAIKARLARIIAGLGQPGACERAARAILSL